MLAMVVRREAPSSAQVGNAAIISESGEWHGWLGGSCIQSTVAREAAAALRESSSRLISLSPDPETDRRQGVTAFPMTCHSGGTVDIHLEPVLPAPQLFVFGVSPTAEALVRLGKTMGYSVHLVDPDADRRTFPDADRVLASLDVETVRQRPASQRGRLFAVVATMGQRDEEATRDALGIAPAYLGVVASRKRFGEIRATLVAQGVSTQALDAIANPAGIDIGARAPEEVALSVVAEIVRARHAASERTEVVTLQVATDRGAIDPVCGMSVRIDAARHRAEHAGRTYYFCCGGCRERFLSAPDQYAAAVFPEPVR